MLRSILTPVLMYLSLRYLCRLHSALVAQTSAIDFSMIKPEYYKPNSKVFYSYNECELLIAWVLMMMMMIIIMIMLLLLPLTPHREHNDFTSTVGATVDRPIPSICRFFGGRDSPEARLASRRRCLPSRFVDPIMYVTVLVHRHSFQLQS